MSYDPKLIPLQAQQQARMQHDAFADLANWTSTIKKTDQVVKKQENTGNKAIAQIRSKRQKKKHVVKVDSDGSEIEDENDEDKEEEERIIAAG